MQVLWGLAFCFDTISNIRKFARVVQKEPCILFLDHRSFSPYYYPSIHLLTQMNTHMMYICYTYIYIFTKPFERPLQTSCPFIPKHFSVSPKQEHSLI